MWPSVFTEFSEGTLHIVSGFNLSLSLARSHRDFIPCVDDLKPQVSLPCLVNQSDRKFLDPPILSDLHQIGLFLANLATKFC